MERYASKTILHKIIEDACKVSTVLARFLQYGGVSSYGRREGKKPIWWV